MLDNILTFFLYAIIAIFAQNAIFSKALGVSRLIVLSSDSEKNIFAFGGILAVVQLLTSIMGYFVNSLAGKYLGESRFYLRPTILVVVNVIVFFIIFIASIYLLHEDVLNAVIDMLPMATFNCCILGTVFVVTGENYNLLQTIAFSIGSSVGYVLAVILVSEGNRILDNDKIPTVFRGLPTTLIYISVLALMIYGFTGEVSFF